MTAAVAAEWPSNTVAGDSAGAFSNPCCMVTCIHPHCALTRLVHLQAHLVLETLLPFRLILHWTTLRDAVIDGLPYHEYWGDVVVARTEPQKLTPPKYQLLRAEDEEEVDPLFQRLKAAGHLDSKTSADDRQD